ncbi:DNA sulfur modification protein DndB [Maridesulfovibrio sp. FT414]|uniref:DNA sulfur modification protein DndB n=1 Tax=Maridesulfovibrio sp. FT414 TaxID=2979469 RepID=UPI003D805E77
MTELSLIQGAAASDVNTGLESIVAQGNRNEIPLNVFVGYNLGYKTLTASLPMDKFYDMSAVANCNEEERAQRDISKAHAWSLSSYILKGILNSVVKKYIADGKEVPEAFHQAQEKLGVQPYMGLQPLVVNLRSCKPDGSDLCGQSIKFNDEIVGYKLLLARRDRLWVIDGQHRRQAMQNVINFLDNICRSRQYPLKNESLYPYKENKTVSDEMMEVWRECSDTAFGLCNVQIEIHLGLNISQERQLFTDMNLHTKPVDKATVAKFDSSNPVVLFTKEVLLSEAIGIRLTDKMPKDWGKDTGEVALNDAIRVSSLIFTGNVGYGAVTPAQLEGRRVTARRFWECVVKIKDFGEEQARNKTVAAQPIVLKSLAKLTYDCAFGQNKDAEQLELLFSKIEEIDFTHENPVWRYYDLSEEEISEKGLGGLREYLLEDSNGTKRNMGVYNQTSNTMNFAGQDKDKMKIIGDMIRYMCGLASREKTK